MGALNIKMDSSNMPSENGITFRDRVYKKFYDMKYDEWRDLYAGNFTPTERDKIIEIAKDVIDRDDLRGIGRQLEFSNDHRRIRVIWHFMFDKTYEH